MGIHAFMDRLLGRDVHSIYKRALKLTADLHVPVDVRDKNRYKSAAELERLTRWRLYHARIAVVEDQKFSDRLSNRPYVVSIAQQYTGFLEVAYTWGIPLDQLHEMLPEALAALDYAGDQYKKVYWADEYQEILDYRREYSVALSCLSMLIGVGASLDQLQRFLRHAGPGGADRLFDRLARHMDPQRPCGSELRFGKHYGLLVQAMDAPAAEQPALIRKYLDGWYGKVYLRSGGSPSHDSDAYTGYWAWEAAAVVMLCGVDDSAFRGHVNYPDQLVDYHRRHPQRPDFIQVHASLAAGTAFIAKPLAAEAAPSRSAALDDAEEADQGVTELAFSDEQLRAVDDLLRLITPTAELAQQQIAQWRAFMRRNAGQPSMGILWDLTEFADWTCTFRVDWKDTSSALDATTELASRWGVDLELDGDESVAADFPASATVADVLRVAHRELGASGLVLWEWDTTWDNYCGWISRPDAAAAMASIGARLGVAIRPCDQVDTAWPAMPALP